MNSIKWKTLTLQNGETISNPSHKDCEKAAIGMEINSEHPNMWVSIGLDDGRLSVLDYYPQGDLILTMYNNYDMESEEFTVRSTSIKFGIIILSKCFFNMLNGDIDSVRRDIEMSMGLG